MKKQISKALLALIMVIGLIPVTKAQFSISVNIAPPALITYTQPECPGDGYIWIPGSWAYSPETGYYWVPGYWTLPPDPGLYWTPGYWAFNGTSYLWNAGYWGQNVGFYGGVNYGFGYFGTGYVGGMWRGNTFVYNTAVTRVNTAIVHNTYINKNYTVNNSRVSFNGKGGIQARATATQRQYGQQQRYEPTADQKMHRQSAVSNTSLHYDNNGGNVKQENIDNQRQNYQNFKQQHQSEPEFKNAGRAVPMNSGSRGGQKSSGGNTNRGGGRR
ncbi:MAG: hypothetical protein DI598_18070 [Pseudopedobacter saltans]|uniref:YXWGXW repeat-containing protein n=1 Tax=Pseudopedobacter saltans TaxID=151895 RepID=A0A2W5EC08_9SPHI|nr:MAG: hypothetical protein DI598_18070 [Pseudopedobacter saltans]